MKSMEQLEAAICLSIADAARLTGISYDTIKRAINSECLPSFRPGLGACGKIMIRRLVLDEWIVDLENENSGVVLKRMPDALATHGGTIFNQPHSR